MNAETILKLIERAREPLLKQAHIKAYAQAMIEKDRDRVKLNAKTKVISEFEVIVDLKSIDETPIRLD
jgi:hypothetical protein